MKALAKLSDRGIAIEPDPAALAREQARQQLRQIVAKPAPTNADIMRVLQAIWERLERLEARLDGD